MVFKIKMVSDEVDGFLREFEIDSESTFLDLNKIILESCSYPDDQMTSFYICNDEWERRELISREDMSDMSADEDVFLMADTRLSEFIEDKGQKLEFVFDPFSLRSFYMSVKDVELGGKLSAPKVCRSNGGAPAQIAESDFSEPAVVSQIDPDLMDDGTEQFYGSDAFSDDDFDLEGFEISQQP